MNEGIHLDLDTWIGAEWPFIIIIIITLPAACHTLCTRMLMQMAGLPSWVGYLTVSVSWPSALNCDPRNHAPLTV